MPTNGYDRIFAYLMQRLIDVHGYSLEDARHEALAVQDLYNEGDGLFEEL